MLRILAWLGGAIFVGSLVCTLFFYGLVLGNPAPENAAPLWYAAGVNAVLFGAFALHHSLFARTRAKRWITRFIPEQMERSFYVWVASLLLLGVFVLWRPVTGMLYRADGPGRWLLYGVQLAGLHLVARATSLIDPLELAGIRQVRRRAQPVVFRTDGPFGLVRHPIYLGWLLLTFGAPTMTVNRMLFAAITAAYLVIAIPWEERSLIDAFGDRYAAYRSRVRWRLIPGIW